MRYAAAVAVPERSRPGRPPLLTAELLSIGTELTVGETRDTNAGDLAADLTGRGVQVLRITALPDELGAVRDGFAAALGRADLVVSTGGLGPTPDDLTREAIAAVVGQVPSVDPELERWLRDLWARRRLEFPASNLKQAWLIPSAAAIRNGSGTAPGWWVAMPDGRLVVALPGPPREMRPMWRDQVVPRLEERGLGREMVAHTYRLAGIGESALADLLGESVLRATNPIVATYARADAVDVRISAVTEDGTSEGGHRSAGALVHDAEARLLPLFGRYVWGRGADTWPTAIDRALAEHGWTLASLEIGSRDALAGLLADAPRVRRSVSLSSDAATGLGRPTRARLIELARSVREEAGADVGVAMITALSGRDLRVHAAIVDPRGEHVERRIVFMAGEIGRLRAALATVAILFERVRTDRVPDGVGSIAR